MAYGSTRSLCRPTSVGRGVIAALAPERLEQQPPLRVVARQVNPPPLAQRPPQQLHLQARTHQPYTCSCRRYVENVIVEINGIDHAYRNDLNQECM